MIDNKSHSELWGCFGAESKRGQEIPCHRCIGYANTSCDICNGTGWHIPSTCLNTVLNDSTHTLNLAFELVHVFRTDKILPVMGGWLDQPTSFREINDLFSQVERMCNDKKNEMSDRLSKMAKRGK